MKRTAFTLMELMVVVIIIGIMAGYALPQYQRAVRKAHERDAIVQLTAIQAANIMYYAKNGAYLPVAATLTAINTGLNINIIPNDMTYAYTRTSTSAFTASATWDEAGTTNDFMLIINQAAAGAGNPCCSTTTPSQCPTRASC